MPVIGVRIEKLEGERKENIQMEGQMRIAPAPRIIQVQETQLPGPTGKMKIVEVQFEYAISYDPPVGEIKLKGTVLFQEAENVRNELVKTWKENRQLNPELGREIIYRMTHHSFLVLMNLARELGLPSPLPLRIQSEEGQPPAPAT